MYFPELDRGSTGGAVTTPIASNMSHVIIVDDDPGCLAAVGESLRQAGFGVSTFGSAAEVLMTYQAGAASCALVDIVMPEKDGIDTIVALRERDPDLRVIAISGGGRSMPPGVSLNVALIFGANGYLPKPFTRDQLIACVSSVVRRPTR